MQLCRAQAQQDRHHIESPTCEGHCTTFRELERICCKLWEHNGCCILCIFILVLQVLQVIPALTIFPERLSLMADTSKKDVDQYRQTQSYMKYLDVRS